MSVFRNLLQKLGIGEPYAAAKFQDFTRHHSQGRRRKSPTPTTKQNSLQQCVAGALVRRRSLTAVEVRRMGTTNARKIMSRLRMRGVVGRTEMVDNGRGGRYARYYVNKNWKGRYAR